jgi:hypothetical protein
MNAFTEGPDAILFFDGFRFDFSPRRKFTDSEIFLVHAVFAHAQQAHQGLP